MKKNQRTHSSSDMHVGPFNIRAGKPVSVKTIFPDAETIRGAIRWTERSVVNTKQTFLAQPYVVNSRFEQAMDNLRKKVEDRYTAETDLLGSADYNILMNGSLAFYAARNGCSELMTPDHIVSLLTAAAIYILDYCNERPDRIENILEILHEGLHLYEKELEEEDELPFIKTSIYDSHYVRVVYQIIKNRNRVLLQKNKEEANRKNGELLNVITANGLPKDKNGGKERELFDRLMKIIPVEQTEATVQEMEELLNNRLDAMILPLKAENQKLMGKISECNKLIEKQNAMLRDYTSRIEKNRGTQKNALQGYNSNPLLLKQDPIQEELKKMQSAVNPMRVWGPVSARGMMVQADIDVTQIKSMVDRANACYSDFWQLAVDRGYFMNSLFMVPDMQNFPDTYKEINHKDIPGEPVVLKDPYAMAYAMVWALENGSDLPWLGGFTDQLCYYIYHEVPWAEGISPLYVKTENLDDSEKTSKDPETKEESSSANESEPSLTQSAMHRLLYTEKGENGQERLTPAHLIYSDTAHMLPRNIQMADPYYRKYLGMGISEIEAFYLSCISQIYKEQDRMKEMLFNSLDKDSRKKTQGASENVQDLKESLRAIKCRQESLEEKYHAAEKLLREKQKKIEELQEAAETDRAELADLRDIVFNMASKEPEDEVQEDKDSNFPYTVQKQTLIFGGHTTWVKRISPLLKGNVKIFADHSLWNFDQRVINNADVIWIQINAIAHSDYYRVVNQARVCNKPLRYFKTSSARHAAIQVMEGDRA